MTNGNKHEGGQSFADRYLPSEDAEPADRGMGAPITISYEMVRAILWRQRFILVGITALVLLAAFVMTLLTTPIYQATATVRVNTQAAEVIEGQSLIEPYIHPNLVSTRMQTLARVIESRDMAFRVVEQLDLHESEAVIGGMATAAPPAGISARAWEQRRMAVAADAIRGGVSTQLPPDTELIAINFRSPDRNLAARVANSYMQNFLTDDINRSIEANSYARTYLEDQIEEVRSRLREQEVSANSYARANRIIGQPIVTGNSEDESPAGTAPSLTAATLLDANARYSEARARRIDAEQRWRAVSGMPAGQIAEVQQDSVVQGLRSRLADLQGDLADLRERYRDDYPPVREAVSEIASINESLSRAENEIKNRLRNEYSIALRQEQGLQQELSQISAASLDEQDARVQYNLINREVGSLQTQLESLLERYNQISAAANLRSNNVTPLDEAVIPSAPSSPNMLQNMLIGLVLGFGLAAVIALLREVLDNKLRSTEDVEQRLGLPVLGQIPHSGADVETEISDPFSPLSEAYASVRASIEYAISGADKQVIQFTSSLPSEGKTTTTYAVAEKFARAGRKVLLVDMDLRRPAVHAYSSVARNSGPGLIDVLYGRVTVAQAEQSTAVANLTILPVGAIPPNPVEVFSSGLVPEFLKAVRPLYDVILIDSSPVMGIADAPLLSRYVDAVVFVLEANRAQLAEARNAMRRLRDMKANLLGVVITKFRALEIGKAYNYQYRYYSYQQDD